MFRRILVAGTLAVGLAMAVAGWHGTVADTKDQPASRRTNAQARLNAAKRVYELSWKHHQQEPNVARSDVEYFHDWSVRWLQAERDLSRTKVEHVAALEGHLKRMQFWKDLHEKSRQRGLISGYVADAAEFFRLEADDWLETANAAE